MAVNSYTSTYSALFHDTLKKSTPLGDTLQRKQLFVGTDSIRDHELRCDQLYWYLDQLGTNAIGKPLRDFCRSTTEDNPLVIPVAAGADGHGVRRLQALSFAVEIIRIGTTINDLSRLLGSDAVIRNIPNVPRAASLFPVLKRNPEFNNAEYAQYQLEPIGAAYVQCTRPLFFNDTKFVGTIYWFINRQENLDITCKWGSDALGLIPFAMPNQRTCVMNNLANVGGAVALPAQRAAADAFLSDVFYGVGDMNTMNVCLEHYRNFVTLLMIHTTMTPAKLPSMGGGLPCRLTTLRINDGEYQIFVWNDERAWDLELLEYSTFFYDPYKSDNAVRIAGEPKKNWFPILQLNDRTDATIPVICGNDEVPLNSGIGALVPDCSFAFGGYCCKGTCDKTAWKRFVFQHKEMPLKYSFPSTEEEYGTTKAAELIERRQTAEASDLKRRAEVRAEVTAEFDKKQKGVSGAPAPAGE